MRPVDHNEPLEMSSGRIEGLGRALYACPRQRIRTKSLTKAENRKGGELQNTAPNTQLRLCTNHNPGHSLWLMSSCRLQGCIIMTSDIDALHRTSQQLTFTGLDFGIASPTRSLGSGGLLILDVDPCIKDVSLHGHVVLVDLRRPFRTQISDSAFH